MTARKPSEFERLNHIVEAIDRIFKFVGEMDYSEFAINEMAQFVRVLKRELQK